MISDFTNINTHFHDKLLTEKYKQPILCTIVSNAANAIKILNLPT
jgi:hypothetical protein